MFNYPGTELFDARGNRRVVWSKEEHEAALGDGWTEERRQDAAETPAPCLLDEPTPPVAKAKSKPKPKES
jgi:hypothetical protein